MPQNFSHDDRRETQLLFGEHVEIIEQKNEWLYVYAIEQDYHGWIHASEYTDRVIKATHVVCSEHKRFLFGTYLDKPIGRPIPRKASREQIVADALHFLNRPYLWGGRGHNVDCSGLINLVYRAQGMQIPRDSGPQCAFAKKTQKLLPADLIYLGEPVTHVIMKVDDKRFIEAPETGKCVRLLTWGKDIWEEEGLLCYRDREKKYKQHYRALL